MGKLAATFFGVYEFAANGTYLDGQGGPEAEVESEDERGGNEVTKTNWGATNCCAQKYFAKSFTSYPNSDKKG